MLAGANEAVGNVGLIIPTIEAGTVADRDYAGIVCGLQEDTLALLQKRHHPVTSGRYVKYLTGPMAQIELGAAGRGRNFFVACGGCVCLSLRLAMAILRRTSSQNSKQRWRTASAKFGRCAWSRSD